MVTIFLGVQCKWPQTQNFIRRRSFCSKYEGYKDICDCSNPLILSQGVPLVSIVVNTKFMFLYLLSLVFPCHYILSHLLLILCFFSLLSFYHLPLSLSLSLLSHFPHLSLLMKWPTFLLQ